jgi:hypothetical protein
MAQWGFLTKHAQALLFLASHTDARLRDLADVLDVTERTAFGIVADLTDAGYVVKTREGRRNRYEVQRELPMRDSIVRERAIGEVLALLSDPTSPNGRRAQRPRRRA